VISTDLRWGQAAWRTILWKAVDRSDLGKDRPIKLNLAREKLVAAPLFGLKATQRPQDSELNNASSGSSHR
jgi:hypothetical protein